MRAIAYTFRQGRPATPSQIARKAGVTVETLFYALSYLHDMIGDREAFRPLFH
jgi:predicted transcriptional regulator